jgi:hypothetical protein
LHHQLLRNLKKVGFTLKLASVLSQLIVFAAGVEGEYLNMAAASKKTDNPLSSAAQLGNWLDNQVTYINIGLNDKP